jgi:dihydrofolate reductase
MARLINTTAMTVDGVIDVGDWFVAQGDHDAASLALFDDDAAMLLGRKTYEGLAGFWPTQTGRWADRMNEIPKFVASRSNPVRLIEAKPFDSGVTLLRYQPLSTAAADR